MQAGRRAEQGPGLRGRQPDGLAAGDRLLARRDPLRRRSHLRRHRSEQEDLRLADRADRRGARARDAGPVRLSGRARGDPTALGLWERLSEDVSDQRYLQRGLKLLAAGRRRGRAPSLGVEMDDVEAGVLLDRLRIKAKDRYERLRDHETAIGDAVKLRSREVDRASTATGARCSPSASTRASSARSSRTTRACTRAASATSCT